MNLRNCKGISFFFLTFLLVSSVSFNSIASINEITINSRVQKISANPPSSGDWLINTTTTIDGQTLVLNGSIIVNITSSGLLTIRNSTIIFNGKTNGAVDGKFNFTVLDGGLTIENSNITTDDASYDYYMFIGKNASELLINGSVFTNIGYMGTKGIIINNNNSIIDRTNITTDYYAKTGIFYNYSANHLLKRSNIILKNLNILHSGYGVYATEATNILIDNVNITGENSYNSMILAENSEQVTIKNSYFDSHGKSFLIKVACSEKVVIENNTFISTTSYGQAIYIDSNDTIVTNNFINTTLGYGISSYDCVPSNIHNNITISNNIIYSHLDAILLDKTDFVNVINNNIVTDDDGIKVHELYSSHSNYNITDNTISSDKLPLSVFNETKITTSSSITIANNVINKGVTSGIYLVNISSIRVTKNTIRNIYYYDDYKGAIYLENGNDVSMTYNTISEVGAVGIVINNSQRTVIDHNDIRNTNSSYNNAHGVYNIDSNGTMIMNNYFRNINGRGILLKSDASLAVGNISIISNDFQKIKSNSLYISSNFDGLNYSHNWIYYGYSNAIELLNGKNVNISHNKIFMISSSYAINLINLKEFTIDHNVISSSFSFGIRIYSSSNFNIKANTISQNTYGIYFASSCHHGTIESNTISESSQYGIYIYSSSNNLTFRYNTIMFNNNGLFVIGDDNIFYNNSFIENYIGAKLISSANGNFFYFNDFINNVKQVDDTSTDTKWSLKVTIPTIYYLGNYWSDYTGVDVVDPIGFGDTPYNVTGNIIDEYPLIRQGNDKITQPPLLIPMDSNLTYTEGTMGHSIYWIPITHLKPATYEIVFNNTIVESGSWLNSTAIVYSVDGLSQGTYNFTCIVYDVNNQSTSSIIMVIVLESPTATTTSTPSTTTGDTSATTESSTEEATTSETTGEATESPNSKSELSIDLPSSLIGALAGIILASLIFLLMKFIKRGKHP